MFASWIFPPNYFISLYTQISLPPAQPISPTHPLPLHLPRNKIVLCLTLWFSGLDTDWSYKVPTCSAPTVISFQDFSLVPLFWETQKLICVNAHFPPEPSKESFITATENFILEGNGQSFSKVL